MKTTGNVFFLILATAACLAPFLLFIFPNDPSDLQITILARILSARLFWEHGFYDRVPQILSGIDPWSSGLFSVKPDSLFMNIVTTTTSITVLYFVRCFIFIAVTSIVLHELYRAPFRLAVGCAACASAGFNILNWLYFSPDYIGGGAVGWGYTYFPLLLVPIVLERRISQLIVVAAVSGFIGLLYGAASSFAIAVFGCYVACLWIVIQINSLRGWIIAASCGAGVAVGIALELYRFLQIGAAGGLRNTFALFFGLQQTLNILIHRDAGATLLGLLLAVVAILIAIRRPDDKRDMFKLIAVYILSMFLDPVMKTFGSLLEHIVPVFVLSTSYYSFIFAPVVFGAFLCVGFNGVRGLPGEAISVILVLIALKLTFDGFALDPKDGPDLVSDRMLSDELAGWAAKQQRAVVVRETDDDMEKVAWRLSRLSPNQFAAFGLYMADGYVPNPDTNYAIFMSNVEGPAGTDVAITSKFKRNIVLNVPVRSHFAETAQGCIEQRSPVAVDDFLALPVLQNAAVQYIISMYWLESKYLIPGIERKPVFCPKSRAAGRPFVYEFVHKAERFVLAQEVSIVKDISEVYKVLRGDPEFAARNGVVLPEEEAGKLHGPVSGIGSEEGSIVLVADDGDRLRVSVSSPKDTLLLIRDSYSQPVIARTEGSQLDVVRVNGAFIGIRVVRGKHEVELIFR